MSPDLRFGVIGWPLGHTLSPAFQQAALDALGVAAVYRAVPTPPEDVEARVREARRGEWRGLNVTIPAQAARGRAGRPPHPRRRASGSREHGRRPRRQARRRQHRRGRLRARAHRARRLRPVRQARRAAGRGRGGPRRGLGARRPRESSISPWPTGAANAPTRWPRPSPVSRWPSPAAASTIRRCRRELRGAELLVNATSLGMAGGPDSQAAPLPAAVAARRALRLRHRLPPRRNAPAGPRAVHRLSRARRSGNAGVAGRRQPRTMAGSAGARGHYDGRCPPGADRVRGLAPWDAFVFSPPASRTAPD